jgi:hypothetical protein
MLSPTPLVSRLRPATVSALGIGFEELGGEIGFRAYEQLYFELSPSHLCSHREARRGIDMPFHVDWKKAPKVSVRPTHIDSYGLLATHAVGVSSGSFWMDELASPGRTAVR